jgi:hypothetical protein
MKIRGFAVTAVVACALGWLGSSAFSQDAGAPAAPPSEAEMMAMMMKLAQPGEEHARLTKALVGDWTTKGKMYMGPAPMEFESSAKIEAVLGGRFVRQVVTGATPWGPFEGHGILGYNNGTKKFVSSWIDSMGTGIAAGSGVENEPGKCWTFTWTYDFGPTQMSMRDEWRCRRRRSGRLRRVTTR